MLNLKLVIADHLQVSDIEGLLQARRERGSLKPTIVDLRPESLEWRLDHVVDFLFELVQCGHAAIDVTQGVLKSLGNLDVVECTAITVQ